MDQDRSQQAPVLALEDPHLVQRQELLELTGPIDEEDAQADDRRDAKDGPRHHRLGHDART